MYHKTTSNDTFFYNKWKDGSFRRKMYYDSVYIKAGIRLGLVWDSVFLSIQGY